MPPRAGSTPLQDLVGFLGELHSLKVDLCLRQQGIDTTTPAGKALFGIAARQRPAVASISQCNVFAVRVLPGGPFRSRQGTPS
jgi:hypothetical protein